MTLVLERFISTPEATFALFLVGRYGFFTQEPPMHLCVPSGQYPVRAIVEGGKTKTYAIGNSERSVTIANRATLDSAHHLFLGSNLGIRSNGLNSQSDHDGKRIVLAKMKEAFPFFLQRMAKIENPQVVIRWLGEG